MSCGCGDGNSSGSRVAKEDASNCDHLEKRDSKAGVENKLPYKNILNFRLNPHGMVYFEYRLVSTLFFGGLEQKREAPDGMALPFIMLESLVVLGFALHNIAIHTGSGSHLIKCMYCALKLPSNGFGYHSLPVHGCIVPQKLEGEHLYCKHMAHIQFSQPSKKSWLVISIDSAKHKMT
ncbi:hypothetical protein D5086_010033 [Populus alba]|uniref:Uncharacterized protein n=1 Tax=Populus alba TaxID=43335 RepID=A0ACC4C9X2_POPAL